MSRSKRAKRKAISRYNSMKENYERLERVEHRKGVRLIEELLDDDLRRSRLAKIKRPKNTGRTILKSIDKSRKKFWG